MAKAQEAATPYQPRPCTAKERGAMDPQSPPILAGATNLFKLPSGHFFDKLRNEPQIQGEKGKLIIARMSNQFVCVNWSQLKFSLRQLPQVRLSYRS